MSDQPASATALSESAIAFSGPAPFCNRFVVNTAVGAVVRIAFMEGFQAAPDQPHYLNYRAAVTISMSDAEALRDVLNQVLSHAAGAGVAA